MVDGVLRIDLPSSLSGALDGVAEGTLAPQHSTFVAGPENRLSVLALEKLLTGETDLASVSWCSPLVLVGPVGCGKSLLSRAVVRRWLPVLGPEQVRYFTAIDFARQLLAARENHQLAEFRRDLRELQLLVIEDIHKLPAKLALHHELRGLLDNLAERNAVVLCTSLNSPTVQAHLDTGLGDRLAAGLLLWLNYPGVDARIELLRLAAMERCQDIDDRQLLTLAENTSGPASLLLQRLREIEVAPLVGIKPSFGAYIPTTKEIIAVVARYFGVTQSALRGPKRRKSLVFARNVAVYLMRTMADNSYNQIGRELGNRDHSTIMHAMNSINKALAADSATQLAVEELRRVLLAA